MLTSKSLLGIAALLLFVCPATLAAPSPAPPRVSGLFTTWDDYYFYAAFQVSDKNVLGTNATPSSQPQQDDDVEIFFETDNAKAAVRSPQTFQMAVSAAGGAYFSVGTGAKIPKAKAIYTYKYAVGIDGTLNDVNDTDTGYTVELAIPWRELGQNGPPQAGATWGFNVISRDKSRPDAPSSRVFSLSPGVQGAGEVQEPSRWTQIIFEGGGTSSAKSTAERVVCARVLTRFPTINGAVVSGEWPSFSRLTFGTTPIDAAAPTVAEEPNTNESPFNTPPTENPVAPPPAPTEPPVTVAKNPLSPAIVLPGGGSIRIIPGGSALPPPTKPALPKPAPKPPRVSKRPLIAGLPPTLGGAASTGPALTGSLTLGADRPPALVMAIYRLDYNGDGRKARAQNVWNARGGSALSDQPLNATGPWFSALRPLWHRQQFVEMRRAGIDVALVRARADDPLLTAELDALTQALQEMAAAGQDYPLIAAEPDSTGAAQVQARVPAAFLMTLPDGKTATVSPGRADDSGIIARGGGQAYADSWAKAIEEKPDFIVIESWNDFTHSTEIAPSRQYSTQYVDQTRLRVLEFSGAKQWRTKYLSEQTPRVIRPKTLYQVPIRIENAGTLPWRAGEGYALIPRWYKDGRLFDDSAPRVPLGVDILPGQSATISVGLVARNSFRDDLEPGRYTLVFDMVQGNERWFSYAGDAPLQIPVTVVAADAEAAPAATFLGTRTPVFVQRGLSYASFVQVRNDGAAAWPSGFRLAGKILSPDGKDVVAELPGAPLSAAPVQPGQAVRVPVRVTLTGKDAAPLAPGPYRLRWFVQPGANAEAVAGGYDEPISVIETDAGASFILSDIPRTMDAGKEATAKLAIQNLGPTTWNQKTMRVGYHWFYLDGVEAQWDGGQTAPLTKDVEPGGIDGAIAAKFKAPDRPGRYALVWDMKTADGAWASTLPGAKGTDTLQIFVTVTGKGNAVPIDLTKYAAASINAIDSAGSGLPREMLPPDATTEVDVNPLLIGKPGPPLYPSGYYAAQTGSDESSNHRIPFLYAAQNVACAGQTIDLPGGNYKVLHLLAASTNGAASVTFRTSSGAALTASIADWGDVSGMDAAFVSPFRLGKDGPIAKPAVLRDIALTLDANARLSSLTLPNAPGVKILAITLEK